MSRIYFLIPLLLSYNCMAQVVTNDRIAYYPFDGNANEIDGRSNGVVFDATLTTDRFGVANRAYAFDGINDYIEIAHSEGVNFNAGQDFAISLWVNINSTQNDTRSVFNDILGKWNNTSETGYPYAIRYRNFNNREELDNRLSLIRFTTARCPGPSQIFGDCMPLDFWHHVVFQKEGDDLYYYEDGRLISIIPDQSELGCGSTQNNHPIQIGKLTGSDERYLTGMIDDLSF